MYIPPHARVSIFLISNSIEIYTYFITVSDKRDVNIFHDVITNHITDSTQSYFPCKTVISSMHMLREVTA